ncbi:hypothetical protein DENSPDRAFT_886657 [Dentipellis sp. KUC8613]|nr:hypothetical protein DENSPDRAFT_886657 [Dentipellis sp. KUC8613]
MQVLPSPPTAQVSSYPLTLTLIGPPALTAPCTPRNHPPCTITPPRNRPARHRARPVCLGNGARRTPMPPRHLKHLCAASKPPLNLHPISRPSARATLSYACAALSCVSAALFHTCTTLMWPAPPSCGPHHPHAAAHHPRVAATRLRAYISRVRAHPILSRAATALAWCRTARAPPLRAFTCHSWLTALPRRPITPLHCRHARPRYCIAPLLRRLIALRCHMMPSDGVSRPVTPRTPRAPLVHPSRTLALPPRALATLSHAHAAVMHPNGAFSRPCCPAPALAHRHAPSCAMLRRSRTAVAHGPAIVAHGHAVITRRCAALMRPSGTFERYRAPSAPLLQHYLLPPRAMRHALPPRTTFRPSRALVPSFQPPRARRRVCSCAPSLRRHALAALLRCLDPVAPSRTL